MLIFLLLLILYCNIRHNFIINIFIKKIIIWRHLHIVVACGQNFVALYVFVMFWGFSGFLKCYSMLTFLQHG